MLKRFLLILKVYHQLNDQIMSMQRYFQFLYFCLPFLFIILFTLLMKTKLKILAQYVISLKIFIFNEEQLRMELNFGNFFQASFGFFEISVQTLVERQHENIQKKNLLQLLVFLKIFFSIIVFEKISQNILQIETV